MLQRAWLGRGAFARALLPVAWLFGLLAGLRRQLYRRGVLRTRRVRVPVIVVGNVVAGGAGKTPVVAAIVEHLQAAGVRCGVISRGYGRSTHDCREVTPASPAREAGDEPLLIARRCGVPVFVAAQRAEAATRLLQQHPATQVLVSDDGLQHLALARDIEIVVFDQRGTGNGWLLPAGPLRETWPRPADLVLRPEAVDGIAGFTLSRALASEAVQADGTRMPLSGLPRQGVVAVAGIARPQAFFDMLQAAGVLVERTLALPDHHDFDDARPLELAPGETLVCTEKDAVKLWRQHPQAWAVPLDVHIDPAFWHALDSLLAAKLSSADGFQTA